MYSDDSAAKLAITALQYRGVVQRQNDSTIFKNLNLPIKKQVAVCKSPYNWKLHEESKKIDQYTAFKATTDEYVTNALDLSKVSSRLIEACYCPEIPYSYGSYFNHGLPGLILELRDKKYVLGVTKIEPSQDKTFKVPELDYDRIITEKEYEAEMGKIVPEWMKNLYLPASVTSCATLQISIIGFSVS